MLCSVSCASLGINWCLPLSSFAPSFHRLFSYQWLSSLHLWASAVGIYPSARVLQWTLNPSTRPSPEIGIWGVGNWFWSLGVSKCRRGECKQITSLEWLILQGPRSVTAFKPRLSFRSIGIGYRSIGFWVYQFIHLHITRRLVARHLLPVHIYIYLLIPTPSATSGAENASKRTRSRYRYRSERNGLNTRHPFRSCTFVTCGKG